METAHAVLQPFRLMLCSNSSSLLLLVWCNSNSFPTDEIEKGLNIDPSIIGLRSTAIVVAY